MRHTPGPWQAFNGYLVRKCIGDVCAPIAHIDTPYRHGIGIVKGEHEVSANIRLIAAAPDLLEALEELATIVQGVIDDTNIHGIGMDSFTLQPARAAIAKAKGEQ